MKKRVSVLKVVGLVFLALVVLIAGVGFYFYNFYVFKTVRICVDGGVGINSDVSCDSAQDCVDLITGQGLDVDLSDVPDFINENFQKIADEAIYCDGTCFVRDVRGLDFETQELEMLGSCEEEESEFLIEIQGKDGLAIWKYLRNRE